MSLLPGSHNQKFLEKMQRHYHRRGSSQYLNREKPIESVTVPTPLFTTKISTQAVDKLKNLIKDFMDRVYLIVKEFKTIDHYGALELLRRHQFFADVAHLINGNLYAEIEELHRLVLDRDSKIGRLQKDVKAETQIDCGDSLSKIESFSNKNMVKFNPSKSLASNIYYHARAMEEEEFTNYYNKTSLSNPITIKNIKNSIRKQPQNLTDKLTQLITAVKNNQANNEQILDIIKKINSSLQPQRCLNPCCQYKSDTPDTRLNKAKSIISNTQIKPSSNVYKSDKSEQYFMRYYKGNNFNLHDVTSISKTKMEEMDKIQTLYNKNLKARKKYEVHQHRYSCSFNGC